MRPKPLMPTLTAIGSPPKYVESEVSIYPNYRAVGPSVPVLSTEVGSIVGDADLDQVAVGVSEAAAVVARAERRSATGFGN